MVAALATIEVTISVLSVGMHASVLSPFYLLIATVVAYVFSDRRGTAAQVGLIGVAMVIAVAVGRASTPNEISRTIVSVLILVMSAVIVYLRERWEGSAAELRELAARDPLTEVGNYRLLHERLGHAAGDDVLKRVAVILTEAIRQQDTVARQGGDEFAVLAPGTDAEGAAMLAACTHERVKLVQFARDSVDATIGWAVYPRDGVTPEALLARADEALMSGKLVPAGRGT